MLDILRKSARGWVGYIIVGAITVVFVLWGAESLVSIRGAGTPPAKVNGKAISETDVARQVQQQINQLQQQYGQDFVASLDENLIRGSVISSLINTELLRQAAANSGLAVSDKMLGQEIGKISYFIKDNQFDTQTFNLVASQQGYTPLQFREVLREEFRLVQMQNLIQGSSIVLDSEVAALAALDQQQRAFAYRYFSAPDFIDQVELSAAEIEEYYQLNQDRFEVAEQIAVDYVLYPKAKAEALVDISDATLKAAYDAYVADASGDRSLELSHILVSTENRSDAEALAEIESIKLDLAGSDFATVAEARSEDFGSALIGGQLGVMEPGLFEPEFEAAALELENVGDISTPVKTKFGYHLIRLDAQKEAVVASFDDKKASLLDELKVNEIERVMAEMRDELANVAFTADTINDVAETFELAVASTELFSRNDSALPAALVDAAFSADVFESRLSEPQVSEEGLYIAAKRDYKAAYVKALAEVEAEIREILVAQNASKLAQEAADEFAANWSAESQLDDSWTEVALSQRNAATADAAIIGQAFSIAPANALSHAYVASPSQNRVAVVVLQQVQDIDASSLSQEELDGYRSYLSDSVAQLDFNQWLAATRELADIKIRSN